MRDRARLPLRFDPEGMLEDVARLAPDDWIDHFVEQNYDGVWQVAPLRGPAGAEHPVMMIYPDPGCSSFSDTPILARCPRLRAVIACFECELECVRLMKLGAGSAIKEHRDHDLSVEEGVVRLHVPVTTGPAVKFVLNHEEVPMKAGECWYLRLSDSHRVVNDGPHDRVHLVIDARINDWLLELLGQVDRSGG
jgi:mannose-6-phosphate isomerase-like protein (cupin superfamily)